jgi:WhiB family redox-sensing transcriptional regulator
MNFQFKPEPWTEFANCQRVDDPEIFFPVTSFANDKRTAQAKTICATCRVSAECLDYAKRTRAQGIWGGKHLTGNERF